MPLTRDTVNVTDRILLPALALFAAGVGASFTLTPLPRLRQTPTLVDLDERFGLRVVGLVFLALALVLAAAIVALHRRIVAEAALAGLALWLGIYAAVCVYSALDGGSSWSAWLWPAHASATAWAVLVSLQSSEQSRSRR